MKLAATKSGIVNKIDRLEQQYQTLLGKQFDGTELSGEEWQKAAIAIISFKIQAKAYQNSYSRTRLNDRYVELIARK